MGADIYLSSKFDKNFDKVEKEIEELNRLFQSTAKQSILDVADNEPNDYDTLHRDLLEKQYSVGYFRDSYNSSSILSQLGLSWSGDVAQRLEDSMLQVEDCKWLLEEVKNRRIGEEVVEEIPMTRLYQVLGVTKPDTELNSEMIEYFVNKKNKLIELLQDAIDLNEPLYCSI